MKSIYGRNLKIGVLKPDNIGDAVMASPFFFELRKRFKKAHITGILSPTGKEVLDGLKVFDNIITIGPAWLSYKKTNIVQRLMSAWTTLSIINKEKFDVLIGLRHRDRLTSMIVSLSNACEKVGYNVGGMGFGINKLIPLPEQGTHEAVKNMELVYFYTSGKCGKINLKGMKFAFSISREAQKNVKDFLAKGGIKDYIILHPVSGHESKDYGMYKDVVGTLSKHYKIIVVGSSDDRGIKAFWGKNIINMAGMLTIKEFGAIIKGAKLVIGNDSAGVHIASALGVKSLTIFSGAAKYEEFGAWGNKAFIITRNIECRGCQLAECNRQHECMDIKPDIIVKTAQDIIKGKQKKKIISV